MDFESTRTLGAVGAILLAIPFLSLLGIILLLISMKGMSEHYNDDNIFSNALYGFIFGIIGAIALIVVILMFIFGFAVVSPIIGPLSGIILLIIGIVLLFVFSLISAIFYRNSLNALSENSGEQMFNMAGLILLIGAAIPLVGEILRFIAWILVAVGFFSIKTTTQALATEPAVIISEEKKFCQYCGAKIQINAAFCQKCGKKTE